MKSKRYGMAIDLDRCNGCGACMLACAVENNVPPAAPGANERTGITPMRVARFSNGAAFPKTRTGFIPVMCQQCGHEAPCASVCPQQAVEVDPKTGVVGQMPERCFGCRYCMTACPYHARYFNWFDPAWPAGMEKALSPGVAPRMRGVVEKCNFCHGRLHEAESKAAMAGRKEIDPADYVPACVEACPSHAITFGDLDDGASEVARLARRPESFRLLEQLGTEPKVHYRSTREWVRAVLTEVSHG
ncbi:MAG TPA: 4Fe-4S dicluster domain-containing protein [Bryobacteraceae bacterium]|nr:4Fe-4S dicluster domain-containing protein [Bryobacteraceae bacterium]